MEDQFDEDVWRQALLEAREQTSDYYLNQFNWRGVGPPDDFDGPKYYPPDLRWRIPARLDREAAGAGQRVQLLTSVGEMRDFDVAGTFVFTADGEESRLTAYSMVPTNPDYDLLFVPFRDATSGKETYGAGRYLDVPRQEGNDDYTLDFNAAYNPSCAYSPRWNCPYPPKENHLGVAVEAGEKVPFGH